MGESLAVSSKDLEEYETRMFNYFSQCSARLKRWYDEGGDDSEAYRSEYNRLSAEYQNYTNYIQQHRGSSRKFPIQSDQYAHTNTEEQPFSGTNPSAPDGALPQLGFGPTTAAACYTRYYQEMISYFDKLLVTLEESEAKPGTVHTERNIDAADELQQLEGETIDEIEEYEDDICCDPQAVMEEYFERFAEIGKWDWASWNNYLSWIARTNPEWYGIFLEYSNSLGIDWDQMYKQWKQCDPITRESFNEFSDIDSRIAIQPPYLKQSVYHGLLFNETVDDDNDDDLFCRTCQMRFNTDRAFAIHLRGVTHIQRALENLQRRNPENIDKSAQFHPYAGSGGADHYAWLQSQYMERTKSAFVRPGSLYCELCLVGSSSLVSLQAHLAGRRHRENVAMLQSSSTGNQVTEKRPVQTKSAARLQTLLDVCTQPLIGLNYIVERQFGDEEDCIYHCELCDDRIIRQDAICHVCSVAHRTLYMKTHFPDLCGIVVSDRSDLPTRMKRLELFARKIEDFEGRKRVKVKRLSAFDALRRIWRPLDDSDTKTMASMKESLVKLSNPHNRINKVATKRRERKPKRPSANQAGDDLEEGEITEDSSDEEVIGDNTLVDESLKMEALPENQDKDTEVKDDGIDTQLEESITTENFLPPSLRDFPLDSECKAYVDSLRDMGVLSLTKTESDSKDSSNVAPDTELNLDEQFSREAEWALDRLRSRLEEEKENRRQVAEAMSAAAAAVVPDEEEFSQPQTTKASFFDKRMWVQRGLDVVRSVGRVFNDHNRPPNSTFVGDEDLRFPQLNVFRPLPMSAGEGAFDGVPKEQRDMKEEHENVPFNISDSLELNTMDPIRKRLAVSSGAAEIILSALGALRESGQLPKDITSLLSGKPKSDQTPVTAASKSGSLGDMALTANVLPHHAMPSPGPGPKSAKSPLTIPPKVAPPQVTPEPAVGLLSSSQHTETTMTDDFASNFPSSKPAAVVDHEVQTRSSSVGLLGDPLLPTHFGRKPIPQLIAPPLHPVSNTKPQLYGAPPPIPCVSNPQLPAVPSNAPLPQPTWMPQAAPQTNTAPVSSQPDTSSHSVSISNALSQPMKNGAPFYMRGPMRNFDTPVNPTSPTPNPKYPRLVNDYRAPPPHSTGDYELPHKVASYMRGDNSTSETIFDAYALYSRRSRERTERQPTPPMLPPQHGLRPRINGDRGFCRNASRMISRGRGGRKMSVLADLFGVNEPPAPTLQNAPYPKFPPAFTPPVGDQAHHWRQPQEQSHFVPVTEVPHSLELPRISYYVPKQHESAALSPPVVHRPENPPFPVRHEPPFNPVQNPRFFGPHPGRFDDFFHWSQHT